jgi:lipoprotein-releasing system permease protein
MPFEIFLALRYLYSRRRRRLARVTALAAICGIAFGVAALILAQGLGNGFKEEMQEKILRGTAHVTVMRRDGIAIQNWQEIKRLALANPDVTSAEATTYNGSLLSGPAGSAYGVMRGVEPASSENLAYIKGTLVAGSVDSLGKEAVPAVSVTSDADSNAKPLPVAVIGSDLSERTGLNVDAVATVVSGELAKSPFGSAPIVSRIRIGGIFRSGLYEYDSTWIYLPLRDAAVISGKPPDSAGVISIQTKDLYNAGRLSGALRQTLGPDYTTIDWQEANRPLFAALALERRMATFIVGLIILIAVLNISTTLILVVVERRGDIAILKAMGARSKSILLVFIVEGAAIGALGAIAGVLIGLITSWTGTHYRLVRLASDVYSISSVPFHPHAIDCVLAAAVAFLLSILATLYPARVATRIRPADALRQ